MQSKLGTEKDGGEPQKVDSEAATNVENTAYAVGGSVYNKAKNRIVDIKDWVKSKENEPKQKDKYENIDDNSLNKPKDKSNKKQGEKPKVKVYQT